MQAKLLNIYILFFCFFAITTVDVSTVEELYKALGKAKAGQIIAIAPGEYDVSTLEGKIRYFLDFSGEKTRPITLKAKDPNDPPILRNAGIDNGFVLNIRGDYWVIENIKIAFGSKAIVLENANYNIIRNVEIFSIGSHAINIRGGSSHNLFQNCYIHNIGAYNNLFGVGVLIGLPHETPGYNPNNTYNVIEGCVFRHTTSEHILIREYSNNNEVFNCVFYGEGINGKSDANSFIMIYGSDNYIHDNAGYRNSNNHIEAAFEIQKVVEDSGDGNKFVNNALFMDKPYGDDEKKRIYVVDGVDAKFSVKNNVVSYGDGLIEANSKELYNSGSVTFLK